MYTSDTDKAVKSASKTLFVYILFTILTAIFGAIYEIFSHEVYSFYMIYAFAFPLVGGVLPFSLFVLIKTKNSPSPVARKLYHCAIATLTVGSIIKGVLEIYGTTNMLSWGYFLVGLPMLLAGIIIYIIGLILHKKRKN